MSKDVDPEVCHIWPFSATNSAPRCKDVRLTLQANILAMSPDLRQKLSRVLVPEGQVAASDRPCNLLSLCRNVQNHWGRARFGLKWHRIESVDEGDSLSTMATILVEVHWMPVSISRVVDPYAISPPGTLDSRRKVRLDDVDGLASSLQAFFDDVSKVSSGGATMRDGPGRYWDSGRLLPIRMAAGDVDDFKTLIDAQWLMIKLAALSGAAEHPEEFQDLPPYPPPPIFADTPLVLRDEDVPSDAE